MRTSWATLALTFASRRLPSGRLSTMLRNVLSTLVVVSVVASAQAPAGKLVVVGHPTFTIAAQCNPSGSGTGRMKIRNEGSKPVSLYLTATELVSRSPEKRVNPQITITQLASSAEITSNTTAPPRTPTSSGTPMGESKTGQKLAAGEELWLQMDISGMHDDGEWETTIQNENVDVGTVRVVTYETPFHLSLDVPNPDSAELTFEKDKPAYFSLKNDDRIDYELTWEYSIDGATVRSSDALSKEGSCLKQSAPALHKQSGSPQDGKVLLPANAFKQIFFSPSCSWFGSSFTGLFKDRIGEGRLTITRVSPPCASGATITKSFKVKTHLMTSAGATRELLADACVFVMLFVGGWCSLVLNSVIPSQMRRMKLEAKLAELGRQVSDLPHDLASRIRVLVGLEQRLLLDRLRRLRWTNSDFSTEMQSIEGAVTRLSARIQLLDRLGTNRVDFVRLRSHMLCPTVIRSMEDTFDKIVKIGEKSDPAESDVQTAQTLIKNLQDQLDNVGRADEGFAAKLSKQAKTFQDDFKPQGNIGKTDTCKKIQQALPGLFIQLFNLKPGDGILPDNYVGVDTVLSKLGLVEKYCLLVEDLDKNDAHRKELESRLDELLKHLKNDSWEEMSSAELLVQEMRENLFETDVAHAVTKHMVNIRPEHVEIRQFDPCGFRLEFQCLALNNAAARNHWTCRWEFSHPDETTLSEEGWNVTHYFQRANAPYCLQVTLINNDDGKQLNVNDPTMSHIPVLSGRHRHIARVLWELVRFRFKEAGAEWRRRRVGPSRGLETLRLLLALFIALLGLIAGAKDQLLKLDLVPAMIAVFLIGFGADQIKNLLTQKQ